jgi:hypothetical protein
VPVRGWYVSGAWLDVAGTWLSDGGRGSGLNYRQVLTQADGYTGGGVYLGCVNTLRETDGTWDNGQEHV